MVITMDNTRINSKLLSAIAALFILLGVVWLISQFRASPAHDINIPPVQLVIQQKIWGLKFNTFAN